MPAGRRLIEARGVAVAADEAVDPFGSSWLIRDRRGFRPCPWAFDLARFAPVRPGDRVVDLGCGGGVLLRALAEVHPDVGPMIGVELSARAAYQARRNAAIAQRPFGVVRADIRRVPLRPRFDLVVANPPFYPAHWGRRSAHPEIDRSTHALHGDVGDFARAAARLLVPHGQAVFVFDADHLAALLLALNAAGLTCRALRFLEDDRKRVARVLTVAHRSGHGLIIDRQAYRPLGSGDQT